MARQRSGKKDAAAAMLRCIEGETRSKWHAVSNADKQAPHWNAPAPTGAWAVEDFDEVVCFASSGRNKNCPQVGGGVAFPYVLLETIASNSSRVCTSRTGLDRYL